MNTIIFLIIAAASLTLIYFLLAGRSLYSKAELANALKVFSENQKEARLVKANQLTGEEKRLK